MPPEQLATTTPAAGRLYLQGRAELLAGRPEAALRSLRAAVGVDPALALAMALLAIASKRARGGDGWREQMAIAQRCRTVSRRERQQIDVIALALDGRFDRASALGLEHLCEFPDDVIVAHVLADGPVAKDLFE